MFDINLTDRYEIYNCSVWAANNISRDEYSISLNNDGSWKFRFDVNNKSKFHVNNKELSLLIWILWG